MSILKPEITGNYYERRKKQPAENQKSTNIEYEVSASPVFTFSFLGDGSLLCPPRQLRHYPKRSPFLRTNEWQKKVLTLMAPILMCSARYRS